MAISKKTSVVKLRRQAKSLIATIPKDIVESLKWKEDDLLSVEIVKLNPVNSEALLMQKYEFKVRTLDSRIET